MIILSLSIIFNNIAKSSQYGGNSLYKKSRDYLYQTITVPGHDNENGNFYQQNNPKLSQTYFYPPAAPPQTPQFFPDFYYHPNFIQNSDISRPITFPSSAQDSLTKDPLTSSSSSPSHATVANDNSVSLLQQHFSPTGSSGTSGIQSGKQSIIFGRSFAGYDGSFYIPVY